MTTDTPGATPQILGPADGEILGPEDGTRDRFLVNAAESGGGFALVEHIIAPRELAAPLHLHTREDEYSYVLEGHVGALLGDHEVLAGPGELVFKPRGQWHTFWNAGDTTLRILEIISPGGLEELFREFGDAGLPEPDTLTEMAARYGAELDFDNTMPIIERHGLRF
ncbi:MAG: cupin domain-containing protein [Euzebyales bacterium]|nr:cupin domain-containing protein [Euzebyales bacterium]